MRSRSIVAGLSGICLALLTGCPTGDGGGGAGGGGPVFNLPPTPIITTDVTRGIAPLTVTFDSTLSTDDGLIVARAWDFGDGGTSQAIRPVHTYQGTGSFLATLTLTDEDGLSASRQIRIDVTQAPVAVITADRTLAENAPALFAFDGAGSFDPDGSIESYRWDFGDGTTDVVPTVTHTFTSPGNFRVRLTVTDNTGVTNTAEILVSVGIQQPQILFRLPDSTVTNLVLSNDASLWVQGEFTIDESVPRVIRAGLDGDRDLCEAKALLAPGSTLNAEVEFLGHFDRITDAAFSPDGLAVLTCALDGAVRRYASSNGDLLTNYTVEGPVNSAAFSPNGLQFVYGLQDGRVIVRNVSDGAVVRTFTGHADAVRAVAFAPSGNRIVSGSADRTAIVWDVASGAVVSTLTHNLEVNAVAFWPVDENVVATGSEDTQVRIFSGASLQRTLAGHTEAVNDVKFSVDGLALLSGSDDNTARLWSPVSGQLIQIYVAGTQDVTAVSFFSGAQEAVTGSSDGALRVFDSITGQVLRQSQPCTSAVVALERSPDGTDVLAAIGSRNDIQLDSDPANGGDLNFTFPQPLQLSNVAALNGQNVPPGQYFLWVEVASEDSVRVRTYATAQVNVIADFTSTVSDAVIPPVVPLLDNRADIVGNPEAPRQVVNLGPMSAGDRIFLQLLSLPGYEQTLLATQDFSVTLLDSNLNIFTWLQSNLVVGRVPILLAPSASFVIGQSTPNFYAVVDGGQSVRVVLQRATGLTSARPQRVYVNFDGATALAVSNLPAQNIPRLNANTFNQFFNVSPGWTDPNETNQLTAEIMSSVRELFDGFDIEFIGSNEVDALPAIPFKTIHVGGTNAFVFGLPDYIDPRNDSQTGVAAVFALSIGDATIDDFSQTNPVSTIPELGDAIARIVARETGHLLGLRATAVSTDLMQRTEGALSTDLTLPRVFESNPVVESEQVDVFAPLGSPDVAPIGTQDARAYLEEVLGPS